MNAAEFVAQFQVEVSPRVSRPKPKPAPTLVPAVAPVLEPAVKAWAPLPGFRPFLPTLAELYQQERGPMNDRGIEHGARAAYWRAKAAWYRGREAFPDQIEDPVKLARFARAQRLTGPKLAAAMPAWVKTWIRNHSAPDPFVFIPNQPAKFPAWTYYRVPSR